MENQKSIGQRNISIKKTAEMETILDYLSERLLLNTTSIIRLSLANLYEETRNGGEPRCQ